MSSVASIIIFVLVIYCGKKRGLFKRVTFRAGANNSVEIEMNQLPITMLEQAFATGGVNAFENSAFASEPTHPGEDQPDEKGMFNVPLN